MSLKMLLIISHKFFPCVISYSVQEIFRFHIICCDYWHKSGVFVSSGAHVQFFNAPTVAGVRPVRPESRSFLRSCSLRSDRKY